jgi:putative hydrolase of the HAD superfamily
VNRHAEADAGAYPDGKSYLEAFNAHLGFAMSREQWTRARAVSMTPFDDMLALSRQLARAGTIAVLTNNVPLMEDVLGEVLPEAVEVFGDRIYFSCSLKLAKPDPEIYRATARLCASAPERCIFTDDKLENAAGAQRAGMTGIHFRSSQQYIAALKSAGVAVE